MYKNVASLPDVPILDKTDRHSANSIFLGKSGTVSAADLTSYLFYLMRFKLPPYRSIEGFCDRPAERKARHYYSDGASFPLRPILYAEGNPSINKDVVCGLVSSLLFTCSPSAVGRFVISIVVDSFNGVVFGWSRTHILEELRSADQSKPSVAHAYPPSTVSMIPVGSRVVATLSHIVPSGLCKLIHTLKSARFFTFSQGAVNVP